MYYEIHQLHLKYFFFIVLLSVICNCFLKVIILIIIIIRSFSYTVIFIILGHSSQIGLVIGLTWIFFIAGYAIFCSIRAVCEFKCLGLA
jgi:hypothetical protein